MSKLQDGSRTERPVLQKLWTGGEVGMTEQEKREKVIKGLGCCQDCDGYVCRNCCPYHDRNEPEDQPTCTCRLAHDALALLKAQEPNEDWISRKRLKDEIQYYIDEAGWGDEVNKVLGWCMEFIDNQMAVKWE